jgi:hypothetical protein
LNRLFESGSAEICVREDGASLLQWFGILSGKFLTGENIPTNFTSNLQDTIAPSAPATKLYQEIARKMG